MTLRDELIAAAAERLFRRSDATLASLVAQRDAAAAELRRAGAVLWPGLAEQPEPQEQPEPPADTPAQQAKQEQPEAPAQQAKDDAGSDESDDRQSGNGSDESDGSGSTRSGSSGQDPPD